MHYRRAKTPGATYLFTIVTYNRQPVFCSDETIALLRQAFHTVKAKSPFAIDAIAILPAHIHTIWTLPEGDADFSFPMETHPVCARRSHESLYKMFFERLRSDGVVTINSAL